MESRNRAFAAALAAVGVVGLWWMRRNGRKKTIHATLGYWDIRGLAAPARMMLAYAEAEGRATWSDVTYTLTRKEGGGFDGSGWFKGGKPGLLARNALANLPHVIDHDNGDKVVTQSTACFHYIGRSLGMMGATQDQLADIEQILAQVLDLRNDTMKIVYPFSGVKTIDDYNDALPKHLNRTAKGHFDKLEGFLSASGGVYFAGAISAADFHCWEMLDQHHTMALRASLPDSSPLAQYPKLAALHAHMRQIPQLQTYFESPAFTLPLNNKMAHIK